MEQLPPHSVQNPDPSHGTEHTAGAGAPKKPWYRRWWAFGLAIAVVLGALGGALGGGEDPATATAGSSPSPTPSAERVDAAASPPSSPARSSTSTPEPAPTSSSATATPTPTPTPTPTEDSENPADPSDYEKLGTRDLALITKNPDSHIGRQVQVYATITQFDAATGDCIFRGNTGYTNMADSWDYEHNSMFMGEGGAGCEALSEFVADDEVFVLATVGPSFSYDTQIGGSTTVPTYLVDGIEIVQ